MTLKTYKLSNWAKDIEIFLEVDLGIFTEELAREVLGFWDDPKWRIQEAGGDVIKAAVKAAAETFYRLAIADGVGGYYSKQWVALLNKKFYQEEGWPRSYEECGIRATVVDVDLDPDLSFDD